MFDDDRDIGMMITGYATAAVVSLWAWWMVFLVVRAVLR